VVRKIVEIDEKQYLRVVVVVVVLFHEGLKYLKSCIRTYYQYWWRLLVRLDLLEPKENTNI
jgi:hypothetical protein